MDMIKQILKNSERAQKELWAMFMSIIFLLVGILVILLLHNMNITGDTLIIAFLLVPIIIWAVMSGRIKTFKAGDLEATFNEPVRNMMKMVGTSISNADTHVTTISKTAPAMLSSIINDLKTEVDEDQPIVMVIRLGQGIQYDLGAMREYIDGLSHFRNFRFLVFLKDEKFVAYMPARVALRIFTKTSISNESDFLNLINTSQEDVLRQSPGVILETVGQKDSIQGALEKMLKQNLEALVVVDDHDKFIGVLERSEVLSRMMLALAGS